MSLFGRVLSVGLLLGSVLSAQAGDAIYRAPAEDRPLSPNIAAIPDFEPVAIKRPYQVAWQVALLAHQQRYVAQLLLAPADPIETGSINR